MPDDHEKRIVALEELRNGKGNQIKAAGYDFEQPETNKKTSAPNAWGGCF